MNDLLSVFLKNIFELNINWLLYIHFILVTYFIGVIISVRRPVGVAFALSLIHI